MRNRIYRFALAALLLLAAAGSAPSANATILFAGGEDVDFTISPVCDGCSSYTAIAGTYRSSWSRGALQIGHIANGLYYWLSKPFTASSDVWGHAQTYSNVPDAPIANSWFFAFWSPDGTPSIAIRATGTAYQLKISTVDESGTATDLVTCPATYPVVSLSQFDIHVVYGVSGEVTLYNNGVEFCTYSGDVTTNSRTQINQAGLYGMSGNGTWWSEVIVSTTTTLASNLLTLAPNANGNTQDWSGASPCTSILNATAINDASYISTPSNNQLEQCKITGTIPAGAYNVDAVVTSMRGLVGGSGPQHMQYNVRTGGADYFSSDITPTTVFSNLPDVIWSVNPATSSAWATSDLSDTGFNIGVKSTP